MPPIIFLPKQVSNSYACAIFEGVSVVVAERKREKNREKHVGLYSSCQEKKRRDA